MTEQEWLTSEDPQAMLKLIIGNNANVAEGLGGRNIPSDRKLRLLACVAWRYLWFDLKSQAEADETEKWAEGLCDRPTQHNHWINQLCAAGAAKDSVDSLSAGHIDARRFGANILRDIVGNPWRPVTLPCSCHCGPRKNWPVSGECPECGSGGWCPWLTPAVLSLARAAYEERQPDGILDPLRLLVLADALEESGFDNTELLLHLRGFSRCPVCRGTGWSKGPCNCCADPSWPKGWQPYPKLNHVRGCWAIDLVLGKE